MPGGQVFTGLCVAHRILESVGGYAKEAGIVSVTAGLIGAAWDRLKDQRR
jgi:hypothetical protein